ncbi:type II secretion system major pseudopilin GspG [Sedimentisphaera salicampi]|uniref:Type II secretion system core protein G n=1 Tax=Sedimentisphaera salicampi TaxID=1941349 RepID=A0A1W6LP92_9BACT|nr:type II secretion system major pseudopilin GspG [Sedimentisphaera salicampi]ARN57543.1 PilD-dependent protein PddA [Sedimentisphaera salicampi]OXU14405.1 PilD-dependent protein PddA [Sedimentisphaera salicampi]
MKQNKRKGFTLIELLLAVVILAVLAAVVVPKFTGRSEEARVSAAKTDISNIELALDSYEIDTGDYPSDSEGLEALVDKPSGNDSERWKGPYLKRGVPDDPWGNEYNYEYPGRHNEYGYDLYSNGPDGRGGTDDDIINWDEDRN